MRAQLILVCLFGMLALASCGEDSSNSGEASRAEAAERAAQKAKEDAPGPTVEVPERPLPKKLVIEDLEVGSGKAARPGDRVRVKYVGVNWLGESYSNSYTYGEVPDFTLGSGELIVGFDRGLVGMKPGGKRRLLVPARLAYQPDGPLGPLGASNTLVFLVEMVAVR